MSNVKEVPQFLEKHLSAERAQEALRVIAGWIGKNSNITVNYHDGSRVDADIHNGVINIPRVGYLDEETLGKLRAFVYHESGHIAETVLSVSETPKGAKFEILNALEDRRMEDVLARRHLGCYDVFQWAQRYFNKHVGGKCIRGEATKAPLWEALCAMAFTYTGQTPCWALSEKAGLYYEAANDIFQEVENTEDTHDCLALAERIYEVLKESKQQQNQENGDDDDESQEGQQQGQGQQSENGGEPDENGEVAPSDIGDEGEEEDQSESGGESGEKSEDGESEDGESGEGEGEEGEGEGESKAGESNSESEGESNEESEGGSESSESEGNGEMKKDSKEPSCKSKSEKEIESELDEESKGESKEDALADDVEKAIKELDPDDRNYTSLKDGDKHMSVPYDNGDRIRYERDKKTVSSTIRGLTGNLMQALRAYARCKTHRYRERGKLDKRRYVAIAKNLSKKVFYTTEIGEKIDTVVGIVIDESGSMGSYREVQKLAIVLGETLASLNIPFEIVGTTTEYFGGYPGCPKLNGFTRTNPIVYRHYKEFHERWFEVCPRIIKTSARKHNIDGEAVEYVANRLMTRPEPRKIVFSLSDGLPEAGQGQDTSLGRNIARVCKRSRAMGIEVYGFGIGTDQPQRFYGKEYFLYLSEVGSMGVEFFQRFSEIITKGRLVAR